ncbi:MAG: hypothetical protein HYU66_06795 [Armatimonadetes bacterium]|nr:hypothetical protein [Armatimonadota bacterium]
MQAVPAATGITQGANGAQGGLTQVAGRTKKLWEECCRFEAQVRQMFDERLTESLSRSGAGGLARKLYDGFVSHGAQTAGRLEASA